MSNKVDISVIVCCYNPSFEQLLKTIISIEKQKNVSFDIVVTDDGSNIDYFEETKKWALKHGFKNLVFNKLIENKGTVRNILSAVDLCKAKYVKTISPGDFLFDEYSLKHYLDCFINDNSTIVAGKSVYFTTDLKIVPTLFPRLNQSCKKKYMKRNFVKYDDSLLGASLAFEKSFLKRSLERIKDIVKYLEDKPMVNMCLMDNKTISISNDILVWYETGSGISTGSSPNPLFVKDLDNYYEYLSKKDDKYYKYVSKVYFDNKKWPRIKKAIIFPFIHPGYFFFILKTKIKRYPTYETDISKQFRITSLEEN